MELCAPVLVRAHTHTQQNISTSGTKQLHLNNAKNYFCKRFHPNWQSTALYQAIPQAGIKSCLQKARLDRVPSLQKARLGRVPSLQKARLGRVPSL